MLIRRSQIQGHNIFGSLHNIPFLTLFFIIFFTPIQQL